MSCSRLLVLCIIAVSMIHQADLQRGFNYVRCNVEWEDKGCSIGFHRNLKILFDDRKPSAVVKINYNDFKGYKDYLKCRCLQKAKAEPYAWFAITDSGICLSQKGTWEEYSKNNPVFDVSNSQCQLKMTQVPQRAPDGTQCILGGYRAYFYKVKQQAGGDRGGEEEERPPGEGPPPSAKPCTKTSDLFLVIDSSGSIGEEGFQLVRKFLKRFMARYNVGKDGTSRIGINTFDENCYPHLNWTQSSKMTKSQIASLVETLPYTAGSTRTDIALNCTRDLILQEQRANINKTVCVMTDGKSWDGKIRVPEAAKSLRGIPNMKVIAIGIGEEVDDAELERITGKKNNIQLGNFKTLIDKAAKTLNDIISTTCV